MDDKKLKWTLNLIKTVKEAQIGDSARLESIQRALEENRTVYDIDKKYLKEKFNELQNHKPDLKIENENLTESESEKILEQDEMTDESKTDGKVTQIDSANKKTEPLSEIESLRKEIKKLQDKNYLIEKHLNQNPGSMLRAFGRGIGGVFLFLFGLGMIFLLAYHFENLDSSMRGMYYGGDPGMTILYVFVIAPSILLGIGGASIYYAIRIISRT